MGRRNQAVPFVSSSFLKNELISRTASWVAGVQRAVEIWSAPPGFLLRVAGGSDFYISPNGQVILSASQALGDGMLNETDRQILLGPVIVLALALRNTWCLHASAVMFQETVIAFLGESGQGKSTLAAYLAQSAGWRLVADDILPVRIDVGKVQVLPHFPQLKLAADAAQPGVGLPERLPLKNICVLEHAEAEHMPELHMITTAQGVQSLLSHIAGTRMFDAALLAEHLEFCAGAAGWISFHKLSYPHRRDALPEIQETLKTLC